MQVKPKEVKADEVVGVAAAGVETGGVDTAGAGVGGGGGLGVPAVVGQAGSSASVVAGGPGFASLTSIIEDLGGEASAAELEKEELEAVAYEAQLAEVAVYKRKVWQGGWWWMGAQ